MDLSSGHVYDIDMLEDSKAMDGRARGVLTVIVPIYNAKERLVPCLESLAAQSLKDLCVIIVNDSSPTVNDALVAESYVKRYPERFTLISLAENSGVSVARNAALEKVQTPYVTFLDSDDAASPKMYEKLVVALERQDCDLVQCNSLNRTSSHGSFVSPYGRVFKEKRLQGENLLPFFQLLCARDPKAQYISSALWNKVFKMDVIRRGGIKFPVGLVYQDNYFVLVYCSLAQSVFFIPEALHLRYIHPGSITTSRPKIGDMCLIISKMHSYMESHKECAACRQAFLSIGIRNLLQAHVKRVELWKTAREREELWTEFAVSTAKADFFTDYFKALSPDYQQRFGAALASTSLRRVSSWKHRLFHAIPSPLQSLVRRALRR